MLLCCINREAVSPRLDETMQVSHSAHFKIQTFVQQRDGFSDRLFVIL